METQLDRQPPELNDQQLVMHAQHGDRSAFGELVRRHQTAIFRVCYRILFDREDAADATQEAFLRAYKNLSMFHGSSAFKTWMVRIAVNVSLNARSRQPPVVPWDDLALLPSPQAALEALHIVAHVQVQSALQLLPPNHRVAVILRDLEGYSYAEIALALDVPEGTAKGWVHRGRQRLKDVLT